MVGRPLSKGNTTSARVERMAKAICGDHATAALYEQALIIAECEIVLLNLRAARVAAIQRNSIIGSEPERSNQIPGCPTPEEWSLALEELARGRPQPATKLFTRAAHAVLAHQAERAEAEVNNTGQADSEQSSPLPTTSLNAAAQRSSEGRRPPPMRDDVDAFQRALPELVKMDRYERRAMSRRKRAIRMFEAISMFAPPPSPKTKRG